MKFKELQFLGWGKANRFCQMFKPEILKEYRGNQNVIADINMHTVMLAVDHPYFYGPTTGLIDPRETISPLVPYADAISPARGTLERCLSPYETTPVILRVSGGNSVRRREELSDEHIMVSIEEAIRLNAIGVSTSVYVDSPHQAQTIKNLAKLANEASKYGLIVLGITAVGANLEKIMKGEEGKDLTPEQKKEAARYLSHAGRIIQEHGADIVKTYYIGEGHFDMIRKGIQVPIVIAGGKKIPEEEALQYSFDARLDGADGVDMGRNIFQAEDPITMIKAVRQVVHEGKTADEAYDFYLEEKNK